MYAITRLATDTGSMREASGKRSLKIGALVPNIVLYNDPTPHPSTTTTSMVISADLARKPDLLLIFGTSLKVHGIKKLVKDFAKLVHAKKGVVILVNKCELAKSEWDNVIDYWVEGDCDVWIEDLKARIPDLWMKQEVLPVLPITKPGRKKGTSEKRSLLTISFKSHGGRQGELYPFHPKEDGRVDNVSDDWWSIVTIISF